MPSFNKVILVGNLTADPELRQANNTGSSVCRFSVAVQRRGRNDQGQTTTDFFNVVAWQHTAEFVCRYFKKGSAILVCGRLQNNNWTDQQGNKRYSTEVVAEEVTFADSKRSDSTTAPAVAPSGNQYTPDSYGSPAYSSGSAPDFEEVTGEDNLPF